MGGSEDDSHKFLSDKKLEFLGKLEPGRLGENFPQQTVRISYDWIDFWNILAGMNGRDVSFLHNVPVSARNWEHHLWYSIRLLALHLVGA